MIALDAVAVAVSEPRRPKTTGVPLIVAVAYESYTLLATDKPPIVTGAAVMLPVNPVGWVNT